MQLDCKWKEIKMHIILCHFKVEKNLKSKKGKECLGNERALLNC